MRPVGVEPCFDPLPDRLMNFTLRLNIEYAIISDEILPYIHRVNQYLWASMLILSYKKLSQYHHEFGVF